MTRFSPGQLQEIRGATLSALLCRNCDQPGKMPREGFSMREGHNPMVHCSQLRYLDRAGGGRTALGSHKVSQRALRASDHERPESRARAPGRHQADDLTRGQAGGQVRLRQGGD